MVHVTTPENSRKVKYSISNVGLLTIYSLNPKSDAAKEKFTTKDGLNVALIKTDYKAIDYQSMLASLFVQSEDKTQNVININYRNPPKTVAKPNRFEVESKRLLIFN
jgi:hypothetical protein